MGLLDIIYRDEDVVAINKPEGLLVHRSRISRDHVVAMQLLRDQIGQFVYTVHRIDRPTSGVLLFALSPEMAKNCSQAFEERLTRKQYLAVCRGYVDEQGTIDRPLRGDRDSEEKTAVTAYERLGTTEVDLPVPPQDTSRYSLVRVTPETGRMHQIRRHFHHISHPLIGDTKHGDGKQNKAFREHFKIYRLLLHAHKLELPHPRTGEPLKLHAPISSELSTLLETLGWSGIVPSLNDG